MLSTKCGFRRPKSFAVPNDVVPGDVVAQECNEKPFANAVTCDNMSFELLPSLV